MKSAHCFRRRLIRWISLSVCAAVAASSLTLASPGLLQPTVSAQNGQANGNARKINPEPPRKDAPPFALPNLAEVRRQPQRNPEAPSPISSSVRSRRKPLESRRGRKVGDPGMTGSGIGFIRNRDTGGRVASSQSRVNTAVRSHHARRSAVAAPPFTLSDDDYIQNFFAWALPAHSLTQTEQAYWNDIFRTAYPQGPTALQNAARELGLTLFESWDYAARNRSDHDYVYELYKTYLMREPDQGGWDAWTSLVPSIGRESVRHGFDQSSEFANLAATITPNGSASGNATSLVSARVDPFNQPGNQLATRDCEWNLPLLSLPGRSGLDLGLGLSYSSQIWTRSGQYLYFDQDSGSPSPGFRLGFATIQRQIFDAQTARNVFVLIASSGQRVELRQVGTSNVYEAADSSSLQLTDNTNDLLLRTTDGTQIAYGWFEY